MPSDGTAQCTTKDFVRLALAEFPELREEFEEEDGLPHLQMGAFARFTQVAKGRADWETYERCAQLADRLWGCADEELNNALYVSYLEHLDFEGSRGPKAWSLLSPRLRQGWREIQEHLDEVAAFVHASKNKGSGPQR